MGAGTEAGGEGDEDQASYPGELFLMLAGALYFAMILAPTEEMRLIAYLTTPSGALAAIAGRSTFISAVNGTRIDVMPCRSP